MHLMNFISLKLLKKINVVIYEDISSGCFSVFFLRIEPFETKLCHCIKLRYKLRFAMYSREAINS